MQHYHTIIVGSGAAGLNCALQLVYRGVNPAQIAIITEKIGGGTSFDAGSDKQTYYKLALVGDKADSPLSMANSLYDGGCMHGDIALIEASCSIQAFMHLVNIGVPFPHDKFGAFVGYKTDNDPLQRGTSAGPLTSHLMGECLLREVRAKGITILDRILVVEIVKNESGHACGVLGLALDELNDRFFSADPLGSLKMGVHEYSADYLVLATGGPAGIYSKSVYPESQWGSLGLAIRAGAILQNLTESQYGIASLKFRWNLSGTYQQVLPRYFSLPASEDPLSPSEPPAEFLLSYFDSPSQMQKAVFLKGYQWPFNPARLQNHGSSLIDLAIHEETIIKGRRVYMDYRSNPSNYILEDLDSEVKEYLVKSGAVQATPIERLRHMNPKAIDLFKSHGIDLEKEPLEIGVCAQHCNGGIMGDIWWQTSVPHLFAIGEANGSHGVHRPGGSALNSGQVGGIRVAEKIVFGFDPISNNKTYLSALDSLLKTQKNALIKEILPLCTLENSFSKLIPEIRAEMQNQMMQIGAYIRSPNRIEMAEKTCLLLMNRLMKCSVNNLEDLISVFKISDALLTQIAFFASMKVLFHLKGGSRGSYLVIEDSVDNAIQKNSDVLLQYDIVPENVELKEHIIQFRLKKSTNSLFCHQNVDFEMLYEKRRPIPHEDPWFENIWREFEEQSLWR